MTRDDIILMAQKSGLATGVVVPDTIVDIFEKFAALVAANEREECAKVCEEEMKDYMSSQYTTDPLGGYRERFAAKQCAAVIRTRGEK